MKSLIKKKKKNCFSLFFAELIINFFRLIIGISKCLTCSSTMENCAVCNGDRYNCAQCSVDFYLLNTDKNLTFEACSECTNVDTLIKSGLSDGTGKCYSCADIIPGCKVCKGQSSVCYECLEGYESNNGKCKKICDVSQFYQVNDASTGKKFFI